MSARADQPGETRSEGKRMGRHIVHRLVVSFPALIGVLFLCFCLLQEAPADPAMIIAGPDAKAETIAAIQGFMRKIGIDWRIQVWDSTIAPVKMVE